MTTNGSASRCAPARVVCGHSTSTKSRVSHPCFPNSRPVSSSSHTYRAPAESVCRRDHALSQSPSRIVRRRSMSLNSSASPRASEPNSVDVARLDPLNQLKENRPMTQSRSGLTPGPLVHFTQLTPKVARVRPRSSPLRSGRHSTTHVSALGHFFRLLFPIPLHGYSASAAPID
jgi:hypothetical protein